LILEAQTSASTDLISNRKQTFPTGSRFFRGKARIIVLIRMAIQNQDHLKRLDYRTSADSRVGDSNRVVGYCSATLISGDQHEMFNTTPK